MDEDDIIDLIDCCNTCTDRPSWGLLFFLLWIFS